MMAKLNFPTFSSSTTFLLVCSITVLCSILKGTYAINLAPYFEADMNQLRLPENTPIGEVIYTLKTSIVVNVTTSMFIRPFWRPRLLALKMQIAKCDIAFPGEQDVAGLSRGRVPWQGADAEALASGCHQGRPERNHHFSEVAAWGPLDFL